MHFDQDNVVKKDTN